MPKKCFDCNIILTDENWYPSDRKRYICICKKCRHRRKRKRYKRKQKICVICGTPFYSKGSRKTCSSKDCKNKFKKESKLKYKKTIKKWHKNHSNYGKEWLQQLKIKFVDMLGGRCQNPDCACPNGYARCIDALEFHHINPKEKEKKRESQTIGFEEKIKAGKIKLLCSNCHKEEHFNNH